MTVESSSVGYKSFYFNFSLPFYYYYYFSLVVREIIEHDAAFEAGLEVDDILVSVFLSFISLYLLIHCGSDGLEKLKRCSYSLPRRF